MKALPILTVLAVTLASLTNGAVPLGHRRQQSPPLIRPRPAAPGPASPKPSRPNAQPKPKAVAAAAAAVAAATTTAKTPATAPPKKQDQYLHSLTKITTFMVKLNSFLELTIGTITKQLTDLTSQMADVRGSLDNLVTSTNNSQQMINAKPPPVPKLLITTPAPQPPAPRPAPRPAPVARPTHQHMMRRPVRQPMHRMHHMQRYVPATYQRQMKPAANQMTAAARKQYYSHSRDQTLRWPGNNEFHPWWKNWWSNNFQGFYPDKRPAATKPAPQQFGSTGSQFGASAQHFGATAQQYGATAQQFGSSSGSSQFGSQYGDSSQFNPSAQFGAGVSPFGGSQFSSFGSMTGGSGGQHMWPMPQSKSREPGESEGKGA